MTRRTATVVAALDIRPLLPKEHIVLGVCGEERRTILRALCAPLIQEGIVSDAEAFLDELEVREDQVTTQMAGGVAFPHARSHAVKRLALTVGLAAAPGLAFAAADPEPCRVFFLMAVPPASPTAHLPLLRYLGTFIRQGTLLGHLVAAQTPTQIVRLLSTFKP